MYADSKDKNGQPNNEFKPHSDYLDQDFSKYISLPEGYSWNASKALALYLYDVKNDSNLAGDAVQSLKTLFGLTSNTLKEAVETVQAVFGESNRLEEVKKYKDGDTSYILGSGSGEDLEVGTSSYNIIYGNGGNDSITGKSGIDVMYGGDGNDTLMGDLGDDTLIVGKGFDTYRFYSGDGNDTVTDDAGIDDVIRFDNSVESSNIAIFKDCNDLIIDYGTALGEDSITVKNQELENNTVERIQLSDGKYLSNEDINKIIQNMTSYAANNGIEFTNIESVKNNEDLMNLVASSWHM